MTDTNDCDNDENNNSNDEKNVIDDNANHKLDIIFNHLNNTFKIESYDSSKFFNKGFFYCF